MTKDEYDTSIAGSIRNTCLPNLTAHQRYTFQKNKFQYQVTFNHIFFFLPHNICDGGNNVKKRLRIRVNGHGSASDSSQSVGKNKKW